MTNKTAYVHDRIFHYGGAQKVLEDLIETYGGDNARLFVLFSPLTTFKTPNHVLHITTALPKRANGLFVFFSKRRIPLLSRLFDYRNLMPFYPLLTALLRKKIKTYAPHHVVISSFAAVKNIVSPHEPVFPKITLYLHSPMQYIRDNYDEYMHKLSWMKKRIFQNITWYLRKRDQKPRQYHTIFVNSRYTAECAKRTYEIDNATVRYPSLEEHYLTTPTVTLPHDYYLSIGRLVQFIREIDVVIRLANELQIPLVLMGEGPDEEYLKSIAGDTVMFIGNITDVSKKIEITKNAKGVINLTKESCGIATMEALALGVPVFGYAQWGSVELVQPDMGVLVPDKMMETLMSGFETFAATSFDRLAIKERFVDFYQQNRHAS